MVSYEFVVGIMFKAETLELRRGVTLNITPYYYYYYYYYYPFDLNRLHVPKA